MKTCTKCGESKALEEFHRDKRKRDGRKPRCKECICASAREYHAANRDRRREYCREYYAANRERMNEHHREWYKDNRERRAQTTRAWREVNRERIAEYDRERRSANPENNRAHVKRRYHRIRAAGTIEEAHEVDQWLKSWPADWCYLHGHCEPGTKFHLEHIRAVSNDGRNVWWNTAPACEPCNMRKRTADWFTSIVDGADYVPAWDMAEAYWLEAWRANGSAVIEPEPCCEGVPV